MVPSISLQLSSEDGNTVTTSEKPTNNSNAEEEDPVAASDAGLLKLLELRESAFQLGLVHTAVDGNTWKDITGYF